MRVNPTVCSLLFRLTTAALLTGLLDAAPATQPAPPSVRVRVARVYEQRHGDLSPANGHDGFIRMVTPGKLQLTLQLAGLPEIDSASAYGHWQVDEATDDQGTDVNPMKSPGATDQGSDQQKQAQGYVDISRDPTDVVKPTADGFCEQQFELQLGSVSRSTKTLRRVAGHFDITLGGKDHVVRFDHPARRVGQELADTQLQQAGVSVRFQRPDPQQTKPDDAQVTFEFAGDDAVVHDDMLDIVGKDGKTVVTSTDASGLSSEARHPRNYQLSRPLDDSMTITVRVALGQKTVRVPFDLRDVPMP